MTNQTLLTRKDLAAITGLTVDMIRRNEGRLGLAPVKIKVQRIRVRYRRRAALSALRKAGILKPA